MAFSVFETSRAKGKPVELYRFRYGPKPNDVYTFTNGLRAITYNNAEYTPIPIDRSEIIATGTLDNQVVEVIVPVNNPVAELYRASAPSYPISLIIYIGHKGDPDSEFKAIWNGRVLGASFDEGLSASLGCQSIASQRQRPGLRRHYQYGCPHVLYSQGAGQCNANKSKATFQASALSVNGAVVSLPLGWTNNWRVPYFINGMLEWTRADGNTETRTILNITNSTDLLLDGFATSLEAGDTVSVIYGCTHDLDGCGFHQNIPNFGGCPWIPTQNPIGQINNFY